MVYGLDHDPEPAPGQRSRECRTTHSIHNVGQGLFSHGPTLTRSAVPWVVPSYRGLVHNLPLSVLWRSPHDRFVFRFRTYPLTPSPPFMTQGSSVVSDTGLFSPYPCRTTDVLWLPPASRPYTSYRSLFPPVGRTAVVDRWTWNYPQSFRFFLTRSELVQHFQFFGLGSPYSSLFFLIYSIRVQILLDNLP